MVVHSGSAATIPCTEFRFTSADGLRVACARWDNRGPVRGVVHRGGWTADRGSAYRPVRIAANPAHEAVRSAVAVARSAVPLWWTVW